MDIVRVIVCAYLAAGVIVVCVRNWWFVLAFLRVVRDLVIWPILIFWRKSVDPSADGGSVIINGGNAKGDGTGGSVVLSVGMSESGRVGSLKLNAPEDDRGLLVEINGKPSRIAVDRSGL